MVHIAGVAGVTLVGNNLTYMVAGQTGYEAAQAQLREDTDQLDRGIFIKGMGFGVIEYAGNTRYPVDKYIAEKHAEREDDGAGSKVGGILGQAYGGKIKRLDAKRQIFDLLCDK